MLVSRPMLAESRPFSPQIGACGATLCDEHDGSVAGGRPEKAEVSTLLVQQMCVSRFPRRHCESAAFCVFSHAPAKRPIACAAFCVLKARGGGDESATSLRPPAQDPQPPNRRSTAPALAPEVPPGSCAARRPSPARRATSGALRSPVCGALRTEGRSHRLAIPGGGKPGHARLAPPIPDRVVDGGRPRRSFASRLWRLRSLWQGRLSRMPRSQSVEQVVARLQGEVTLPKRLSVPGSSPDSRTPHIGSWVVAPSVARVVRWESLRPPFGAWPANWRSCACLKPA